MCIIIIFAVFIAHNWVLATDVVRIDLKRSVSISSFATLLYDLLCPLPMFGPLLFTHIVKIDLKRSVPISTFPLPFAAMFMAHIWALTTEVVKINLKRSVSRFISSCIIYYSAIFFAHNCALSTVVVRIDLKRSDSISSCIMI